MTRRKGVAAKEAREEKEEGEAGEEGEGDGPHGGYELQQEKEQRLGNWLEETVASRRVKTPRM